MDKFRRVRTADIPPLEVWVAGENEIYFDLHIGGSPRIVLSMDKARQLRDWLTAALPCDHLLFTGQRRADPFGKSDAWITVTNECTKCGFKADGGGKPVGSASKPEAAK